MGYGRGFHSGSRYHTMSDSSRSTLYWAALPKLGLERFERGMVRYTYQINEGHHPSHTEGLNLMPSNATLTVNEFAAHVESDGRTVRKFLRDTIAKESHPGKGSRWALPGTKRELNKLTKQFNTWAEAKAPKVDEVDETEVAEVVEVEDTIDEG